MLCTTIVQCDKDDSVVRLGMHMTQGCQSFQCTTCRKVPSLKQGFCLVWLDDVSGDLCPVHIALLCIVSSTLGIGRWFLFSKWKCVMRVM